ncbi:vWA domain-containing protein [Actinocrispum sp. NPDC049592]|uniref:vWA domain-containing protein n=1 Tax=Actinocrispum sp. NPDC049592 TaxID=3154835 RepID=UPI003446AD55
MRSLATVLVLLCIGLSAAAGMAPAVPLPAASSQPDTARTDLAGCVQNRHSLAVLLLMDTSHSLNSTDRDNKRVLAARLAVDNLHRLVSGDKEVTVQVALAGFANKVDGGPWRDLNTSAAQVTADIEAFRGKNQTYATDYIAALNGAREMLADQAVNGDRKACQALIWFTDGKNEPNGLATTKADTDRAQQELCRQGGVVDRLRGTDATWLTVGLNGNLLQPEKDLLGQITGVSPGCGTVTSAGGARYLSAGADDLADAFADLLQPTPPQSLCEAGRNACTFTLERSMRSFYVIIHTSQPDAQVSLRSPGGETVRLNDPVARQPVAGAALSWEWFDHETVRVSGDLPANTTGQWSGTWEVLVPTAARSGRIWLYGNLKLQITGEPRFTRGQQWTLRAEVSSLGAPVDLAQLRPEYSATVTDGADERPAQMNPIAGRGEADLTFSAPGSWHASEVTVKIKLSLRTPSGVDISPAAAIRNISVDARLRVTPTSLEDLPSIRGRARTGATLTITATDKAGCFWLAGDIVLNYVQEPMTITTDHPEATNEENCVRLAPHTADTLDITFKPEHGWSGSVTGTVPLMLKEDGGTATEQTVKVSFRMVAAPDVTLFRKSLAGVVIATISPLLLLFLVNWLGLAKIERRRDLRTASVKIDVTPNGSGVDIESAVNATDWTDELRLKAPSRVSRNKLIVGELSFKAHFLLRQPFAAPRTRITVPRGRCVATPTAGPAHKLDGLPTYLPGTVAVIAEATRGPGRFQATVVYVQDTSRRSTGDERRNQLRRDVHAAAERLVVLAGQPVRTTEV